jgi:hypothetical protein
MHKTKVRFSAVLLLGLSVGGFSTPAYAVPSLSFSLDGGLPTVCADGDACDINPLVGVVSFSGSLGDFAVNVTTGLSKPALPGSHMDLNSVNVQASGGAHTLTIMWSDTGFLLSGPLEGLFGGTITGNGSTVTASVYFDETDAPFGQASLSGTTGPLAGPAFAAMFDGPGPLTAPYSLTQVLTISTTGVTTFSGDFDVKVVPAPEPTSVTLLGGALFVIVGALRKKRSRSQTIGNG